MTEGKKSKWNGCTLARMREFEKGNDVCMGRHREGMSELEKHIQFQCRSIK